MRVGGATSRAPGPSAPCELANRNTDPGPEPSTPLRTVQPPGPDSTIRCSARQDHRPPGQTRPTTPSCAYGSGRDDFSCSGRVNPSHPRARGTTLPRISMSTRPTGARSAADQHMKRQIRRLPTRIPRVHVDPNPSRLGHDLPTVGHRHDPARNLRQARDRITPGHVSVEAELIRATAGFVSCYEPSASSAADYAARIHCSREWESRRALRAFLPAQRQPRTCRQVPKCHRSVVKVP